MRELIVLNKKKRETSQGKDPRAFDGDSQVGVSVLPGRGPENF